MTTPITAFDLHDHDAGGVMRYRDRYEAGRRLAALLEKHRTEKPIVLAVARGGLPVGFEIAAALDVSLDVLVVRKLCVPWQPELSVGAISEGGGIYLNQATASSACVGTLEMQGIVEEKLLELRRQVHRYREDRAFPELEGRTVIVVDDGIATGGTLRATVDRVRQCKPLRVVVAVPVAPEGVAKEIALQVDEFICPMVVGDLRAIGLWYEDFSEVTDTEATALLERAHRAGSAHPAPTRWSHVGIELPDSDVVLEGDLEIPEHARGIVFFVHGSGSGRHSSRNQYVARALREAGFATLLFDLLAANESSIDAKVGRYRFDISLLVQRVLQVTKWIRENPQIRNLPIGCFGSSTGAAAALVAAAGQPQGLFALVSRGGRVDLAQDQCDKLQVPTLLVVGGQDARTLYSNRRVFSRIVAPKELIIIPGATHLFEEPGALEEVARRATDWFVAHLPLQRPKSERPATLILRA